MGTAYARRLLRAPWLAGTTPPRTPTPHLAPVPSVQKWRRNLSPRAASRPQPGGGLAVSSPRGGLPAPSRLTRSCGTCTPGNRPGIRSTPHGGSPGPSSHEPSTLRTRPTATFRPPSPNVRRSTCSRLTRRRVASRMASAWRRERLAMQGRHGRAGAAPARRAYRCACSTYEPGHGSRAVCATGPVSGSDVLNERESPALEVPGRFRRSER